MLKALFLPLLLSSWRKGKIACLSSQLSEQLPGNYLLEAVSLIMSVWASTIVNIFQKKHSLSDHLLGHHRRAQRWHHAHSNKSKSALCPNVQPALLSEWVFPVPSCNPKKKKKQSLYSQGEKSLVPSTCAIALSALYLFKFANKGCYCDSWTKGAIKISEMLAPFPASWAASSSQYLGAPLPPSRPAGPRHRTSCLAAQGWSSSFPLFLISLASDSDRAAPFRVLASAWFGGSLIPVSGHCATKEKAGGEIIRHCSFLRETMTPGSQEKCHHLTKLSWKVHIDIVVKLHTQELVFPLP